MQAEANNQQAAAMLTAKPNSKITVCLKQLITPRQANCFSPTWADYS